MPSLKADITISVKVRGKSFTLNCVQLPDKRFLIKVGRSRSKKIPVATLTDIYALSRKWANGQLKKGLPILT